MDVGAVSVYGRRVVLPEDVAELSRLSVGDLWPAAARCADRDHRRRSGEGHATAGGNAGGERRDAAGAGAVAIEEHAGERGGRGAGAEWNQVLGEQRRSAAGAV